MKNYLLLSVILIATMGSPAFPANKIADRKKPPNVVIIFIDDMGYADIGPFGAKAYPTGRL